MSGVYLEKCDNYNYDSVSRAIDKIFENAGGIEKIVSPNDNVFLKINLVIKKAPDVAATTHPLIVEVVAKKLIEAKANVIIGDSPGGPYTKPILQSIYRTCGIEKAAENSGAKLNYDLSFDEYIHNDGIVIKRLKLIKPLMDCDKIIAISKLKTHGMTLYTGAVKVMFGAIPGIYKAEYHYRMKDIKNFSQMLVDITTIAKPTFSIIDGVYGMEGEGPTAGKSVNSKVILGAFNPYDLDVVGAHLMGISPSKVSTIQRSKEMGLTSGNIDDIEIIGEKVDSLVIKYDTPDISTISFSGRVPKFVEDFLNINVLPRPVFSNELCIGCSNCKNTCPPGAIEMINLRPKVDLKKCIRCFCCQELCPQKAVTIKRPGIFNKIIK